MKVEVSLMDWTMENIDQLLINTKKSIHWIEGGKKGLIEMFFNSNYYFFQLTFENRLVGIVWLYDFISYSARIGIIVWERISNLKELLDMGIKLFSLKQIEAIIDKPNNKLSERLLLRLGFTKHNNVYLKEV